MINNILDILSKTDKKESDWILIEDYISKLNFFKNLIIEDHPIFDFKNFQENKTLIQVFTKRSCFKINSFDFIKFNLIIMRHIKLTKKIDLEDYCSFFLNYHNSNKVILYFLTRCYDQEIKNLVLSFLLKRRTLKIKEYQDVIHQTLSDKIEDFIVLSSFFKNVDTKNSSTVLRMVIKNIFPKIKKVDYINLLEICMNYPLEQFNIVLFNLLKNNSDIAFFIKNFNNKQLIKISDANFKRIFKKLYPNTVNLNKINLNKNISFEDNHKNLLLSNLQLI